MKQPESIILAFANNSRIYLQHQNYEITSIRDIGLKNAVQNNHVSIIQHYGANMPPLLEVLTSAQGNNVTMLHYSGHSSKEGLIIEREEENAIVKTESLVDLVRIHKKFRLIFLNGCYSESLALELINIGVPYVVGTTDKVNDRQAAIVATQFYYFLARSNRTIDDAFSSTKLYFEDPFYIENPGIREAFRSIDLPKSAISTYPWKMYRNKQIADSDSNWVLVPGEDIAGLSKEDQIRPLPVKKGPFDKIFCNNKYCLYPFTSSILYNYNYPGNRAKSKN